MPFLGDRYGAILTNGEPKLAVEASGDGISVWYYEHRLPLSPGTCGRILPPAAERFLREEEVDPEGRDRMALLVAGFDEFRRPARNRLE